MGRTCYRCSMLQKEEKENQVTKYYCNEHDCYVEDIYGTDNPCSDSE